MPFIEGGLGPESVARVKTKIGMCPKPVLSRVPKDMFLGVYKDHWLVCIAMDSHKPFFALPQ